MVLISSTFTAPAEGVLFQTPGTKLLVNDQDVGTATLYITESNVVWGGGVTAEGTPTPSISLLYPHITLHAIQREPSPALYLMLSDDMRLPGLLQPGNGDNTNEEDDDDDFDAEDQPITQLRFVPSNEAHLPSMYNAMNAGQALHPDDADDDDYLDGEDGEDDDYHDDDEFEDAEESGAAPDAARLRQLRLDHAENGDGGMTEE